EEAARLRDELKRLRATELAVVDDPTAKNPGGGSGRSGPAATRASLPSPLREGSRGDAARGRSASAASKVHKPALDEMGIALYHEVAPHRPDNRAARSDAPHKPTLHEMGPGPESKPHRPGPRSTTGRPGMRGGWRPRGK